MGYSSRGPAPRASAPVPLQGGAGALFFISAFRLRFFLHLPVWVRRPRLAAAPFRLADCASCFFSFFSRMDRYRFSSRATAVLNAPTRRPRPVLMSLSSYSVIPGFRPFFLQRRSPSSLLSPNPLSPLRGLWYQDQSHLSFSQSAIWSSSRAR
jgi:hypothetical protein